MSRTQLPTEPVKENAAMKVTPVVPGVRTKEPKLYVALEMKAQH